MDDPAVICAELRQLLAQPPDPERVPRLAALLHHKRQSVRNLAGRTLGKWQLPGTKQSLVLWYEAALRIPEWHTELIEAVKALTPFVSAPDTTWLCESLVANTRRLRLRQAEGTRFWTKPLFNQLPPELVRAWVVENENHPSIARRETARFLRQLTDSAGRG